MELIKPKKLQAGGTIGIMSPSGYMLPERVERGKAQLEALGFNVVVHPQTCSRYYGAAGTTEEKINALHDLFADPAIDIVMTSRGGSRAIHMLDKINYDLIRKNPKIFIGYSDITALLSAFYTKANLCGIHGAQLAGFDPTKNMVTAELTLPFLMGDWSNCVWPQEYPIETLQSGEAEGILFGGNLHLLYALAASGNNYIPDMKGKILIVEDVGEEKRSIDRMFGALRLRGVFNEISGLVVGQMTEIMDTDHIPFERDIADIVREHTQGFKGPIVLNAPIGHEHPNIPFPLGIRAQLTAENNAASLKLLESPFSDA